MPAQHAHARRGRPVVRVADVLEQLLARVRLSLRLRVRLAAWPS